MATMQMVHREETLAAYSVSVERVIEVLRRTSHRLFTLEEMAEIACISPFHFNRVFRRCTGVSPRRFQYSLRIEHAKKLLVATNMAPMEVCLECGYSSLGTFTRRFGHMVGWPPQRFREMSREAGQFGDIMTPRTDQTSELLACLCDVDVTSDRSGVSCLVRAPASFRGWTFVAAFEDPVPQGMPAACTIVSGSGYCRLGSLRDGVWHIMAAGIEQSVPDASLLHDRALRAVSAPLLIRNGLLAGARPELYLREPRNLDVPILLPLGLVLGHKIRSTRPNAQALYADRSREATPTRGGQFLTRSHLMNRVSSS